MNTSSKADKPEYDTLSLTSFVLIALSKSKGNTGIVRSMVENAKSQATMYVEKNGHIVTEPYQAALVAYALSVGRSSARGDAYTRMVAMQRESE